MTAPASLSAYKTDVACTAYDGVGTNSGGPTVNLPSGTNGQQQNSLPIGPGDAAKAIVCRYTKTSLPTLTIVKETLGGVDAFDFSGIFTAGTGGSVGFSIDSAISTPTLGGWSEKIFADPGCTGSLQPGATLLFPPSVPTTVTAGQQVCVIVQEYIPGTALPGYTDDAKVRADFVFTNATPSLSASYMVDDITTVSNSALELMKEVRNVTQGVTTFDVTNKAKSGDTLEYRVTYTNNAASPISNLTLNDVTPAYTTFVSSTAGTTPATLTACNKTTPANPPPAPAVACGAAQPAGGTGPVSWSFTGTLSPGGTGFVLFQVKVD